MARSRWFLAILALGGSLALVACGQKGRPGSPPNVLLILTDDQGYGDIAAHGNPVVRTPAMDRLYAESIRFTNFHVSPTCSPTRAALMTGRYSNATGVWHTVMGRSILHPDEVTLADCFRASGYRTGIFGKWHLGDNHPSRPEDRGFDETLIHGGGGVWQTPDYFGNDYLDDTYLHNGRWEKSKGFCTDVWFENARRFMEESARAGRPFFCYLATNAPHGPMWAPEDYESRYRNVPGLSEPGFFGMIANIDDNLGKLRGFLAEKGLDDNMILIFMTDNGTSSGERVFNGGMRGKKGSPYEGGHRVPFFIRWPAGGLVGPRDISALAAHVDVLPTLVELCDLRKPDGPPVHGRSLKPLLEGRAAGWPERVVVTDSQREELLQPWRQTAVMTQKWRLVNPSPDGDPTKLELYDMETDPAQDRSVAASHPDVVARLRRDYDEWWRLAAVRADEYIRIVLGGPENPVRLTGMDWHGDASLAIWNQKGVRAAPAVNGWWAVDVRVAGRYRFELRRWPVELGLPINARYQDTTPNRETTPGSAIGAIKARLKIGGRDETKPLRAEDRAAVFEVDLPPGPARLETWFYSSGGAERGAYYVYVEHLSAPGAGGESSNP